MEKEVRYIQLPPIPEDIEIPALGVIWLVAKMDTEERKDALHQIEAMIGNENDGEMDYDTMKDILDKYSNLPEDEVFTQYIESFRRLVAGLIIDSYDIAAYVYQKRCVEKQSLEEMMSTTRLSENALKMFVKYFDIRHESKRL